MCRLGMLLSAYTKVLCTHLCHTLQRKMTMEEDEDIRTKAVQPDQKRRTFFKAALAASAIPVASIARVGTVKRPVSWVHGNSATIVGVHNLEMDVMQGNPAHPVIVRSPQHNQNQHHKYPDWQQQHIYRCSWTLYCLSLG